MSDGVVADQQRQAVVEVEFGGGFERVLHRHFQA